MDINALKVADTSTIHVKNASGEPLYDGDKPVTIVVFGPGSREYGTVESRQTQRALKRMNDNEGKVTAASAEERLKETAEDLAAVTKSMDLTSGDLTGVALFEAVYGDPKLGYITRQVSKHLADWANFKQGSAAG